MKTNISLPVFVAYCEHFKNNNLFLTGFKLCLDSINVELAIITRKYDSLIPPKFLELINKYYYIDFILYKIFILQDNSFSYENLYNELVDFINSKNEAIKFFKDSSSDPDIYYIDFEWEVSFIDSIIGLIMTQFYLNSFIAKIQT
jgi:hypothetical protein